MRRLALLRIEMDVINKIPKCMYYLWSSIAISRATIEQLTKAHMTFLRGLVG